MSRYEERIITYAVINVSPDDLITMADASKLLGLTMSGLRSALASGKLTEIRDNEAQHNGRYQRYLLKSEVEAGTRDKRLNGSYFGDESNL